MTVLDTALLEQRRAEILRVAAKCFAEKGFTATTMAYIAKSVGMSVGNLYNYFSGKDVIVRELANKEREHLAEETQKFLRGEQTKQERHDNLVRHIKERMRYVRARVTLEIFTEATHNDKIAAIVREFDGDLRCLLRQLYRCSEISLEQVEVKIILDMALIDGLMLRGIAHPEMDIDVIAHEAASRIIGEI